MALDFGVVLHLTWGYIFSSVIPLSVFRLVKNEGWDMTPAASATSPRASTCCSVVQTERPLCTPMMVCILESLQSTPLGCGAVGSNQIQTTWCVLLGYRSY